MTRARKVHKPAQKRQRPKIAYLLDALLVAAIAVFASYTVWVASLPTHLEWTIYGELKIPASIASQNNASEVRNRLAAAGYLVRDDMYGSAPALYSAPSGDNWFRAWVVGLGQTSEGLIVGDGKSECGYMRGDSWEAQVERLRVRLQMFVADAMLPLDVSTAYFGDYDFACWDTFGLSLYHGFLVFALVGTITLWAAVPRSIWYAYRRNSKG